jgi:peptidoglycan hydrolase-like protein with peptidoglycan-binding domain
METIAYLPACKKQPPNSTQIKQTRTGRIGIRVLSLLMGCAIVGFTPSVVAQTLLRRGDSGQAVSDLQIRLQELGCYNGGVTGVFGEQTEAGVIECQQRFGITADGIVGTETYNALGLDGSTPGIPGTGSAQYGDRLQLGDRGPGVQELQTRLQAGGYYYGAIDGIFGSETQTAVIALQQNSSLPPTGVVDQQVYAVLGGDSSPITQPPITPPTTGELRFGDRGNRVVELQRQLRRLGYPIQVDGVFGNETEDAVRRFQQANSLPVTGVADARTLNRLGLGGDTSPLNPRRYAVIIPIPNPDALRRVQQVLPNAVPRQDRRGDFVREGVYLTPEAAERRANNLRSLGLTDARVVFE